MKLGIDRSTFVAKEDMGFGIGEAWVGRLRDGVYGEGCYDGVVLLV